MKFLRGFRFRYIIIYLNHVIITNYKKDINSSVLDAQSVIQWLM